MRPIYSLFVLTLLSVACKPVIRPCCVLPAKSAELTAQKNGTLWSPFAVKGLLSKVDSLTISATSAVLQSNMLVKQDSLAIKILYFANGSYKLAGSQAFYATFDQSGSLTGYQLDPSFDNVINITGFQNLDNPYTTNPNQVKVTGTFNLKFIDPKNAGGISLSNGNFYAIMNR